ncbi:MAG: HEAT repeat domain-containing protein [Candidatus Methylomirabilales bacterium]
MAARAVQRGMVTDESKDLQSDAALRRELTEILVGIRKANKTFLTYSGAHPARARALDEPHKRISNLLTRQAPLTLRVSRDGFFHGETLVGQDHPLLRGFTTDLFLRGIRTVHFLPGIRLEDLQHLTELFIMDAAELSRQGGATAFLQKRGSTTVRLEDIDFTFTEKPVEPPPEVIPTTPPEEIAEEPAETPPPQSVTEAAQEEEVQADLEGLILELKKTDRPARYEHLTQELSQWGREALAQGEINPCLRIMTALASELSSPKDESIKRYARPALLSLVGETGPQPVIEDFCRGGTIPEDDLVQLLLTLNEEMTGPMVKQLLVEEQTAARRKLMDLLPRMGPPFQRAVMSALKAPSWEAVRRLFPLLVQLPTSEAQQITLGLARHSDPRIRREVIRSFGHMDPGVTRSPLLAALQDQDTGVRQTAIATLGGLKAKEAVPMLRQIAEERPGTRDLEEQKAAIAVLGAIGDPQALPILIAILRRKQWLSRKPIEELRLAAASALGELGGPEATEALRGVARSARSTLRQACERALSRAQSSEGGTR